MSGLVGLLEASQDLVEQVLLLDVPRFSAQGLPTFGLEIEALVLKGFDLEELDVMRQALLAKGEVKEAWVELGEPWSRQGDFYAGD